jgi:hypothetical protein
MTGIPRGQRLNNPLCMKRSKVPWQGKAAVQPDEVFECFEDPHHGIRAAARNLLTYYRRDKLDTVQEIVSKWAPPSDDNDTAGYISAVSQRMGIGADTPIDLENDEVLASLVVSMMKQEIGHVPYPEKTINLAVKAAYSGGTAVRPPTYQPDPQPAPAATVQPPAPPPAPTVPAAAVTSTGEKIVPPLVDQPTAKATRKVRAGSLGALGGLPVAWIAKVIWDRYYPAEPMPVDIAIAIAAAAASAFSYLVAYYTRNRATGVVVPTQD